MSKTICGLLAAAIFAASGAPRAADRARGQYLTEGVAQCQNCHTQRLTTGEFDRSSWLKGGKAGKSIAPDITTGGQFWKRWGDTGMLQFLMTATAPDGSRAIDPMPRYRLRRDDADAIVAYLKNLP